MTGSQIPDAYKDGASWIPHVWPASPWVVDSEADKMFKYLRFTDFLRLIAGLVFLALLGTFIGVAATHEPGRACPSSMDESACAGVYCGVIIGSIFPFFGFVEWKNLMDTYHNNYKESQAKSSYHDRHAHTLQHQTHKQKHHAADTPLLPQPKLHPTKAPFAMTMYPPAF